MHDRDRQRQALADAERQGRCQLADIVAEAEAANEVVDATPGLVGRQMEQAGMEVEVLANRELGIEREGLRHVADARARGHVVGVDRTTEQHCRALAGRQQSGQHFHRRGLAAAVGAHEAEDLAALDVEAHMVDRGEVREAAGEIAGCDHPFVVELAARWNLQLVMARLQLVGQQADEGVLDRGGARPRLELGRRAGRQDLAGVHGDQPVEAFRFLHVGRRHDDAHARTARPHAVDELPELPPGQRIDAGRGLVEDQQVGVVDQGAAQAELLAHAAGKLLGKPAGERGQSRAVQQVGDPRRALGAAVTEQPTEEVDVFPHAEVGIEVLSQALRHVGDARTDRAAMARIGHVAAQHFHPAVLDALGAGYEAQQRRLADAVGADQSDDAVGRNIERDPVEGDDVAISVADACEADNRGGRRGHLYGFPCSRSGQSVLASNLT